MLHLLRSLLPVAALCGTLATAHAATATAKGGSVSITLGHEEWVDVSPGPNEGEIRLTGEEGTLINGEASVVLPLSKNLAAKGAKGASIVIVVEGVHVPGNVTVQGAGAYVGFGLGDCTVGGNVKAMGKGTESECYLDSCLIEGNVQLALAKQNNEVEVTDCEVDGSLTLTGGAGNDELMLEAVMVGGKVKLDGKGGNDTLGGEECTVEGALAISHGRGEGEVVLFGTVVMGPTTITCGEGESFGLFVGLEAHGAFKAQCGPGPYQMSMVSSELRGKSAIAMKGPKTGELGGIFHLVSNQVESDLKVSLSNLTDQCLFNGNTFTGKKVELLGLAGDDAFQVIGNTLDGATLKVDGGKGEDALVKDALEFTVVNVEDVSSAE